MTVKNIDSLKAELIGKHIAYEDEVCGCSEKEILEIEAKYGNLPLNYRQIIGFIGHSAGFFVADISFYVSTNREIDQIICANEDFLEFKRETIEKNEVDDDLLNIPENIFIIYSWDGNDYFILTDFEKQIEDSTVYVYDGNGKVEKKYSSVWEWINEILTTSFEVNRSNLSPFWLQGYRKPEYLDSGKIIIHKSYKNPDIVKQFINSEESRQWYENRKNI